MKLVAENTYGAYIGATPAFLQEFKIIESNPNFDVFDSNVGNIPPASKLNLHF
jgi:hypothetical protein